MDTEVSRGLVDPMTVKFAIMWNPIGIRSHLDLVANIVLQKSSYIVFVHNCSCLLGEKMKIEALMCLNTPGSSNYRFEFLS